MSPSPHDGLPQPRRAWATATLTIAVGLATLDTAIANVALPAIAADLQASAATSVWVINAYQLAVVATILPLAALGEIVGHRRIYIWGLALFTLASLACGLAWSLPTLAGARILQGLGASAIMSVNAALIRFINPEARLGRALGFNALVVAVGFAVGPSVASAVLSVASWPWLFLVNVPFGLAGLALALPTLPVTARAGHRFDALAGLLAGLAFTGLVLGITESAHQAPWPYVTAEWTVSALCFVLLWRREAGHPAPMLAVDLFRLPMFALSAATSVCSFAAQGLAFVALPFLFETVLGRSQVETGFLMTPWPVVVGIMAPIAGRLSDRYPVGALGGIGMAILAGGMLLLAAQPDRPDVAVIVCSMAICGAGFGFFQSPNLRALLTSAPPSRTGSASGIVGLARLIGQTTGAALVAACFHLSPLHGPRTALLLGAGFAGLACMASFARLRVRPG